MAQKNRLSETVLLSNHSQMLCKLERRQCADHDQKINAVFSSGSSMFVKTSVKIQEGIKMKTYVYFF